MTILYRVDDDDLDDRGRPPRTGRRTPRWWRTGASFPTLRRVFRWTLGVSLRNPRMSMIAASFLPVLGFVAAGTLTEQFFPPADRDQFQLELRLAQQASLDETLAVAREASLPQPKVIGAPLAPLPSEPCTSRCSAACGG